MMSNKQSLYLAAVRRQDPKAAYSINGDTLIIRWRSQFTKKGHVIMNHVDREGRIISL